MKKNIVITGGGGFIGHHLAQYYANSFNVIILDNFSRSHPRRLSSISKKINVIDCDITNYDQLSNALAETNIDKIFHLAAINGTENFYNAPLKVMDVGVLGCFNILKYAKQNIVNKVIIASSAEVYQNSEIIPTPEDIPLIVPDVKNARYSYGLSKIYTEYYSYHFGVQNNMNISIFRPHNVYGRDMGLKHVIPEFIMEFLNKEEKNNNPVKISVKGQLESVRAFCYVSDIIDGINLIAEFNKGVNVYNIGNPDPISMYALLQKISMLTQIKFEVFKEKDTHVGSTSVRCPDISKITKLGYKPSISLENGLKETIQWYSRNYKYLTKAGNYIEKTFL